MIGVIRECGGKMHLREGEFEKAHTDFFEAFKVNLNKINFDLVHVDLTTNENWTQKYHQNIFYIDFNLISHSKRITMNLGVLEEQLA